MWKCEPRLRLGVFSLCICAMLSSSVLAEESTTEGLEDEGEVIAVEGEAPYIPVASRSVRDRDLLLRPRPRPADVLRVVPGMFVNQHAGGGKANQYFLRGFDVDHGTDVAFSFDGVPANMVSHGHGQGYTDLNWVIPELVQRLDIFKGPYAAKHGDFATAGAINLVSHTDETIGPSYVSSTVGLFNTYRGLVMVAPPEIAGIQSMVAGEIYTSDGPFDNKENYRRYNLYGKATHTLGAGNISLSVQSYDGRWTGSGQIPDRAVESGLIRRFGSLDPTEGGESARHSVYAQYQAEPGRRSRIEAMAYVVKYDLSLFSNFTFFSANPDDGDQVNQLDDRVFGGAKLHYRVGHDVGSIPFTTSVGVDARGDMIDTAIHETQERMRLSTSVLGSVNQGQLGAWAQEDIRWSPWLRTVVGARADFIAVDVVDRMAEENSGTRSDVALSPKASLVITPVKGTDVFANYGLGYHSNDARSLARAAQPGTPLTQARGYELGVRTRLFDRLDLAGSLWMLDLDSEVVWVGDEGVTEARGATRRIGAEVESRLAILPWLVADLDVTITRGRFRDAPAGEARIPLAPGFTLTGGVSARHDNGWFGRLGVRSLGDRPLTEDGFLEAQGFTLLDMTLGYRNERFEVALVLDNLTNTEWREAQFATTSRLPGDPTTGAPPPADACPAETRIGISDAGNFIGCEDVHFTPGAPFNGMVNARVFF